MDNKNLFYFSAVILMIILIEIIVYIKINYHDKIQIQTSNDCSNKYEIQIPTNIEINGTGLAFDIIPNIVHYILFSVHEIQFGHFISILSAIKNQRPDMIYIHCDCQQLSGDYYQRVLKVLNKTNTPLIIRKIERPTEIFGHKLSKKWLNWHSSDIARNGVLREFGGIYLDRDVYVVKSLNEFFKYEITVDWSGISFATPVIIAHKNARFLKLWLESYHNYTDKLWYYNAAEFPTQTILVKRPQLVHRVKRIFGYEPNACPMLYGKYYKNWKKHFHTIHYNMRGNQIYGKYRVFPLMPDSILNVTNIYQLNVTFGEMARLVLDFEKQINFETKK